MKTIILKFGGASVSSPSSFNFIAEIIKDRRSVFENVIVVVSAMGKDTDELISLAKKVHPDPPRRELDMLISVGERKTIALLAMALALKEIPAISFTGSQAGVITSPDHFDAKIIDIKAKRIEQELKNNKVVIVAGFQGMGTNGDITTLGRGGSDTTAVALGVALNACRVEFFKDVHGIYNEDPKTSSEAKLIKKLNYDEAFKIVEKGARILHGRSILLAKKNNLQLNVLSFSDYKNTENSSVIINSSSPNKKNLESMPKSFET